MFIALRCTLHGLPSRDIRCWTRCYVVVVTIRSKLCSRVWQNWNRFWEMPKNCCCLFFFQSRSNSPLPAKSLHACCIMYAATYMSTFMYAKHASQAHKNTYDIRRAFAFLTVNVCVPSVTNRRKPIHMRMALASKFFCLHCSQCSLTMIATGRTTQSCHRNQLTDTNHQTQWHVRWTDSRTVDDCTVI